MELGLIMNSLGVSLREKGVDLNSVAAYSGRRVLVSLREKGVDLNYKKVGGV